MWFGLISSFAVGDWDWVLGMCVMGGLSWERVGVWKVMGWKVMMVAGEENWSELGVELRL